jgi:hypothetical protein
MPLAKTGVRQKTHAPTRLGHGKLGPGLPASRIPNEKHRPAATADNMLLIIFVLPMFFDQFTNLGPGRRGQGRDTFFRNLVITLMQIFTDIFPKPLVIPGFKKRRPDRKTICTGLVFEPAAV